MAETGVLARVWSEQPLGEVERIGALRCLGSCTRLALVVGPVGLAG
jgi:hypothetical protein